MLEFFLFEVKPIIICYIWPREFFLKTLFSNKVQEGNQNQELVLVLFN